MAISYGVRGQSQEAQAEAAGAKPDYQDVSADFIVDASLATIYGRGKQVAGLA